MIITFLGKGFKTKEEYRAEYYYDAKLSKEFNLKKSYYTNMLPLLIDNFPEQKIVPVFTKEAKDTQIDVLEDEFSKTYEELFDDRYLIKDIKDFSSIMKLLNTVMTQEGEYIIDLTHSFRHLPILATIALISNNTIDTHKIKHIFFAKEESPATKDTRGRYEIIDLKNYIELADVSYMLSTFNQNYTISSNIKFSNPLYQQLSNELKKFSEYFLSNSLQTVIEGNLIDRILKSFKSLENEEDILNLSHFIKSIRLHLKRIHLLKGKKEYEKFYDLAKILHDRGYQLNALTLLFEGVGYYCKESIYTHAGIRGDIDKFKKFIKEKKDPKKYSTYALVNQSRNIVKLKEGKFNGDFLYYSSPEIKNSIYKYLKKLPEKELKSFKKYIFKVEELRNNLAHGNADKEINDIKNLISHYIKKFDKFIIKENILGLK